MKITKEYNDYKYRIGIIYPPDGALDYEFWNFAPSIASLHFTRTKLIEGPISLGLVEKMSEDRDIDFGAETFQPIKPNVVAYACTSASFCLGIKGEKRLLERIESHAKAPSTTTSTAIVASCKKLKLKNVAIAAPYDEDITNKFASFLKENKIDICKVTYLGLREGIAMVSDDDVIELGIKANDDSAEGIIIACTNLKTYNVIHHLEKKLNKPIITANQATIWHAGEIIGINESFHGIGKLFNK